MALGQFADTGFIVGAEWTLSGGASRSPGASIHGVASAWGEITADKGLDLPAGETAQNANAVTCDADSELTFGFWANGGSAGTLTVYVSHDDGSEFSKLAVFTGSDGWAFYAVPFVARRESVKVKLAATGSNWNVDDIAIGFTPATYAVYTTLEPTNLGGAPEGFPKGEVPAGVKVKVAVNLDGGIVDPEAQRILLTSSYTAPE